jgi:UDP-N-acetylglucosamine--N-acetylmuramyl-(pentapeptide) pyrophosphoryl-undecaprenol N-acetylglucosamine transferase
MERAVKIIISGGGTGGHIFPAVSIARALKRLAPDCEILFVGANGRMEMEKVPAAGFEIVGLDIQGIDRSSILKNLELPLKLMKSLMKAHQLLKRFKPDVAVGVGGYASGPLLFAAGRRNVPYLIQEQNSYAGVTNKKLSKKAAKICVAFEHMDAFFPADKILLTGNPIRRESVDIGGKRAAAQAHFGIDPEKKTILVLGGSLGSATLNKSVYKAIDQVRDSGIQLIWQCGNYYYESYREKIALSDPSVRLHAFLQHMDMAYAAADLIISRSGAGTISELCAVGKPVVLVPSPNVAEDHQTVNAKALTSKGAALLVRDSDAEQELFGVAIGLLKDEAQSALLSSNIKKLAMMDADEVIAREVLSLAKGRTQ